MAHLEEALEIFRSDDPSHVRAGARFEHLVRDAFKAHPGEYGSDRFSDVWLWSEWPEREELGFDPQDLGIDLVAEQTEEFGGGRVAIQVKYGRSPVSTNEIDSFISASANLQVFRRRMLVTSRQVARNASKKLATIQPHCEVLPTAEMDDWVDDWRPIAKGITGIDSISLPRYEPRDYQKDALKSIAKGFADDDRGKLIMPCGTGKSLVALWAAEQEAGPGSTVLYLVPSIALMGQTMREWSRHKSIPIQYIGVCSDPTTGRAAGDVRTAGDLSELAIPVTTDSDKLAKQLADPIPPDAMRVVFSTYHSTPKIAKALATMRAARKATKEPAESVIPASPEATKEIATKPAIPEAAEAITTAHTARATSDDGADSTDDESFKFGLIICDEAHRTTGISVAESGTGKTSGFKGISPFLLVHQDHYIGAKKRLFMTATPRVFTEKVRQTLLGSDDDGYSMDDVETYGDEFYRMDFAEALDMECLSDYKVVVIVASEASYLNASSSHGTQIFEQIMDDKRIDLRSAALLAGCWDALASPETSTVSEFGLKPGQVDVVKGGNPALSAIAFSNTVRASKRVAEFWPMVARSLSGTFDKTEDSYLQIEVDHIDSNTPAAQRAEMIRGLRSHAEQQALQRNGGVECRVMSNARVLSEGVDVPALDAVLFMEPRRSEIDITQAVGRVMRKAEGKECGYIVIPVVIDEFGKGTREERTQRAIRNGDFSAVWQVVRALRSHDERVDYWLSNPTTAKNGPVNVRILNGGKEGPDDTGGSEWDGEQLVLSLSEGFASMLVERVGDRHLYPNWGRRASQICNTVQRRVDGLTAHGGAARPAFERLLNELRESVSTNITETQAAQMIAQHLITIPVFDVMFQDANFKNSNPVSKSINRVVAALAEAGATFEEERRPLARAYKTMQNAFEGAPDSGAKLDALREIYDGFFKAAMADQVKSLGIAYTPVELVDFMLLSVDDVCRELFGVGLTSERVNILDPFTGTGTFINRLFTLKNTDGKYLIRDNDLLRKYKGEVHSGGKVHATELVLLAYYIAALKIEEALQERLPDADYEPFPGIVLTDTFLMNLKTHQQDLGQESNVERKKQQEQSPIQVIFSNPPWSSGQDSAGDDNQNIVYKQIGERVKETYAKEHRQVTGRAPGGNATGNLYVKAFRWASDRIDLPKKNTDGPAIIAYVHPNSLTDGTSLAGMRKTLRDEFTDIYVINLRGNAYKQGEEFRREGEKIFGGASRNGVQITILARDTAHKITSEPATLRYLEVPEYSTLEQKFEWLAQQIPITKADFVEVPVTKRHDWANLGDPTYNDLMPLAAPKSGIEVDVAASRHASGVKTNCDVYLYSYSRDDLLGKVSRLIDAYNDALDSYKTSPTQSRLARITANTNLGVVKWTDTLKQTLRRQTRLVLDESLIREVLYRPFTKLWLYEDYRIASAGKSVSKFFPRREFLEPQQLNDPDTGSRIVIDTDVRSRIENKAPTPPPQFSSLVPPTKQSSASSHQPSSTTSVPQEPSKPAEPTPADDSHHRPVEPNSLRDHSLTSTTGSSRTSTRHSSTSTTDKTAIRERERERQFSSITPDRSRSESSPHATHSPTSASQADKPESTPANDPDHFRFITRRDRRTTSHKQALRSQLPPPRRSQSNPPPTITITTPSGMTIFGLMASHILADINLPGSVAAARVYPR